MVVSQYLGALRKKETDKSAGQLILLSLLLGLGLGLFCFALAPTHAAAVLRHHRSGRAWTPGCAICR